MATPSRRIAQIETDPEYPAALPIVPSPVAGDSLCRRIVVPPVQAGQSATSRCRRTDSMALTVWPSRLPLTGYNSVLYLERKT